MSESCETAEQILIMEILKRSKDRKCAELFAKTLYRDTDFIKDQYYMLIGDAICGIALFDSFEKLAPVISKHCYGFEVMCNPLFYLYLTCFVKPSDLEIVSIYGESLSTEDGILEMSYQKKYPSTIRWVKSLVDNTAIDIMEYSNLEPGETHYSRYFKEIMNSRNEGDKEEPDSQDDYYMCDESTSGLVAVHSKDNTLDEAMSSFPSFEKHGDYWISYTFEMYGGEFLVDISEFESCPDNLINILKLYSEECRNQINDKSLLPILIEIADYERYTGSTKSIINDIENLNRSVLQVML